ncbi:MAG: hypothetical protein ABI886_03635 [Betaproteobacteria bacterium]
MKKTLAIAIGTAALLSACAGVPLAQDANAPALNPDATATQSGSSMNMSSQIGQMDDHMNKMQALHHKMTSATTLEKRRNVMDEQRQEMQESMAMMKPMMQGGAMMGAMGAGMMGQKGQPADANAQMQMMQKRMDMMQMTMQTMMDQQGMMAGPRNLDTVPKK